MRRRTILGRLPLAVALLAGASPEHGHQGGSSLGAPALAVTDPSVTTAVAKPSATVTPADPAAIAAPMTSRSEKIARREHARRVALCEKELEHAVAMPALPGAPTL